MRGNGFDSNLSNYKLAQRLLVPQMDDTAATGGLSNFIENCRHGMREMVRALSKIHENEETAR